MKRSICCSLLLLSLTSFSQIGFQNTYGGEGFQNGLSCQQTTDGGYVFFGITHMGPGHQDMHLVRTDEWGNELWTKTYETSTYDIGRSVKQMNDGGFILCGATDFDDDSLAVIRTDPAGEIIWQRKFRGAGPSVGQQVIFANNGDILVVGYSQIGDEVDVLLVRLDPEGGTVWVRIHERPGRQFTRRIVAMDDGGFAYFGTTGGYSGDMLLVRTDQHGDTLWTRVIGTDTPEQGMSLATTGDGGFILLGHQYLPGGDLVLMKADASGEIQWTEFHGGDGWDLATDVVVTDDGCAIAGRKHIVDYGHHLYFIKTDALGVLQWENTYPMHDMSEMAEMEQTIDGGYIMVGIATVFDPLTSDFYAVKIDANGYVGIGDLQPLPTISAFPNPFNDQTRLSFQDHDHLDLSFELKDAMGKTVRTYKGVNNGFEIHREGLAGGLYILQWSHKGQFLDHLKLMVQ